MKITIITVYRGHDAETFVQAVEGELSTEERKDWRQGHNCDEFYEGHEDNQNNMWFRTLEPRKSHKSFILVNADSEPEGR